MRKTIAALTCCVSALCLNAQTIVGAPDTYAKIGSVTGGAGGKVVYPTTADSLHIYMDSADPLVIVMEVVLM